MLWCVDTSAWIDAVRLYNPASPLFERLWGFLEQEILAGRVLSPKAVHDELREKTLADSPPFAALVKRVKGSLFAEETPELQARFAVIVNEYPDLTKKGKPFARSDADAWVVALAEIRGAVVVSQEKPKPSATVPWKIPDVASARGLTTAPLHEFLDSIQGLSTSRAQGTTADKHEKEPE
jgi:predicted nucleic acid-binding protein